MAQSGYVRQRIENGLRDETGRFRIAAGTSSLHKPDPARKGISIAELQLQARGTLGPWGGGSYRRALLRLHVAGGRC